jgi:anti-sigma regulatory factor (Ser/Thr protein kinase)
VNHTSDNYCVTIKNKLSEINQIFPVVELVADKWGISDKIKNQIILAIEEVVSNILFYAYNDQDEHLISIELCLVSNGIKIKIIDDGKHFNLLDSSKEVNIHAPVEEREIGGLGIHLLKTMMDKIEYKRDDNKNKLTLIKYF